MHEQLVTKGWTYTGYTFGRTECEPLPFTIIIIEDLTVLEAFFWLEFHENWSEQRVLWTECV
jgi:hypothetical protein